MLSFEENRKYIENEFEEAVYDKSTGLSSSELRMKLRERQNAYRDEQSRPIFCADCYAYILDNAQLCFNPHTPFPVKFDIGVNYTYFASADIVDNELYNPQRDRLIGSVFPDDYRKMFDRNECGMGVILTDFWHTVPDWRHLLDKGFTGILAETKASKARLLASEHMEKQIDFLDSVIICFEAMLRMMKRMRDYSLSFGVAQFTEGVGALMEREPRTLYEVMLFSVLFLYFEEIGMERARTLGPIDRLYEPYYDRDLENGVTKEEICELFRYFFIHFTASKRYAQQPFTIGGGDENGVAYKSKLTLLILDIYDGMRIYDPKIHVRICKGTDEALLSKVCDMIRRGHSSMCLLNDETVFKGYERLGIPRSDAKEYVLLGCYEPTIMGKEDAEIGITWLNMVKCLEYALFNGHDVMKNKQFSFTCEGDCKTFDDFLKRFLDYVDEALEFALYFTQAQSEYATRVNPSPVYSATFADCLEKATDVREYPLKYNNMSMKCFGLATVVDSLVAVKKYVFDRRELTFDELRNALAADWNGYEALRNRILADPDKYGNGLSLPDEIMCKITRHLAERYTGRKLPKRGGVLRVGLDSIYKCVDFGRNTAATPDGRKAGTPVSKNLCASVGMDRKGITGYMRSVLKIDAADFLNSAVLDFVLHPTAVAGEDGLAAFTSLVKVFFDAGGFAMQGNVLNADDLKQAKAHPGQHRNVQVRVCGWNEYFVNLSEVKQDLFIEQSEALLN